MRWIFRYTESAQKKLAAILKKKMPKAEPWMHVAIKTWSQRNPFCGAVIFIWDTRQVLWEHRFNNDVLDPKNFTKDKGWQRALDNRQPLVGGRKDVNEFFEFGPEFDASHGSAFDGKDRVKQTDLYKRRMKKSFDAGNESDLSDAAEHGGKIDLTKHEVHWMHDNEDKKFGIICEDNMCYMVDETGEMLDLDDDYDSLVNFYQLLACEAAQQKYEVFAYVDDEHDVTGVFIDELTGSPIMDADDRIVVDSKDRAYQEYLRLCRRHHFMPQKRVHGRKFIEKHIDAGTQWHQDKSR